MRIFLLILLCGMAVQLFPMASRVEKLPMKVYGDTEIADGEYLHYILYFGGEKDSDYYYVTRKERDEKGNPLYRIYGIDIPVSDGRKPPENYTNWSKYFLIDPKIGSVIESEFELNPSDSAKWASGGMGYLVYGRYQLFREQGYAEYHSKKIIDHGTNERTYKVKFNTGIPSENVMGAYFTPRFLNPENGGISYSIIPEVMKEPIATTMIFLSKDTLQTKAGVFRVRKYYTIMADPFLAKLMEPVMNKSVMMIEDTVRRVVVKSDIPGGRVELEEISNVLKK